ncbi:MAG: hypothetical protein B7X31_12295 [Thiomonas sp. 13-66-29]|jgi:hypothetical protein|nr:MAG: hypothetical protein B7X31_12295 [Thiomonas sp. 13-66-29]
MNRRLNQALNFVTSMLRHCSALEVAAAFYNAEGKVAFSPWRLQRQLTSPEDLKRMMGWAGAMNAGPVQLPSGIERSPVAVQRRANIWVRPADQDHAWAFVDDLNADTAERVAQELSALAVQTSEDSFQAWVRLASPLTPTDRCSANRSLALRFGSDPQAISEPRWGRMPGFKQTKPSKKSVWTNVLIDTTQDNAPMQWASSLHPKGGGVHSAEQRDATQRRQAVLAVASDDGDESRREFAFACHRLRAGWSEERVIEAIASRAYERGKRSTLAAATLYAERTVAAAQQVV